MKSTTQKNNHIGGLNLRFWRNSKKTSKKSEKKESEKKKTESAKKSVSHKK